tara:strand:+ start:36705 stop:37766 length:1062 start_codon:yes stop_codon:yes gene_type:complete
MSNHKCIIGIVFGGESGEHDVSIQSARTIVKALNHEINNKRYEALCIYIDKQGNWWPPNIALQAISKGYELKSNHLPPTNGREGFKALPNETDKVDIWFPVLHGPFGEDGCIQGLFSLVHKPFVGSGVLGSALGMDKIAMKSAFASAGLPQCGYETTEVNEIKNLNSLILLIKRLEKNIGYPCFIKPANLGSSVGITKAYNSKELKQGLEIASQLDSRVLIEKNVLGRELECAVLGKAKMQTSSIGEVQHHSDWYDYQTKYSANSIKPIIPAALPKLITQKIQSLTLAACKAIAAHSIARVDFFYSDVRNEILINEINTFPGFTAQSMYPMLWAASGLTIEDLVSQLIETARE